MKKIDKHVPVVDKISDDCESIICKYQKLAVGDSSILHLLRYEIIILFFSWIPGGLGYFMRKILFPQLFQAAGKNTLLGSNLVLRNPGNIILGDEIVIDENVTLDAKGGQSRITMGDRVFVGKNSILSCANSEINLGSKVSIGPNCTLRASRSAVRLGSEITIGGHTIIISGNPNYKRLDIPMLEQNGFSEGIVLEDDIWLGVGVRVVDGVRIGKGSVVGAGAVVTENIPDYSIAAGVPAKVIKNRK